MSPSAFPQAADADASPWRCSKREMPLGNNAWGGWVGVSKVVSGTGLGGDTDVHPNV